MTRDERIAALKKEIELIGPMATANWHHFEMKALWGFHYEAKKFELQALVETRESTGTANADKE